MFFASEEEAQQVQEKMDALRIRCSVLSLSSLDVLQRLEQALEASSRCTSSQEDLHLWLGRIERELLGAAGAQTHAGDAVLCAAERQRVQEIPLILLKTFFSEFSISNYTIVITLYYIIFIFAYFYYLFICYFHFYMYLCVILLVYVLPFFNAKTQYCQKGVVLCGLTSQCCQGAHFKIHNLLKQKAVLQSTVERNRLMPDVY